MPERFTRRTFLRLVGLSAVVIGSEACLPVKGKEGGKEINITGVVLDKKYLPPSETSWTSELFFSLKTPNGIKGIQVEDYKRKSTPPLTILKETINVTLAIGTEVQVSVPEKRLPDQFFVVSAEKIRVLGEE